MVNVLILVLSSLMVLASAEVGRKIVGGSSVSDSNFNRSYPDGWGFMVLSGGCTASAISSRWILTAGHCGDRTSVRVGSPTSGTKFSVSRQIRLSKEIGNKDIALLRTSSSMSSAVKEFGWVHGISSSTKVDFTRGTLYTAGWGSTSSSGSMVSRLRYVKTKWDRSSSDGSIRTLGAIDPNGSRSGDRVGHCYGDSGGVLTFEGRIIGVTSYVSGPEGRRCEAGKGGFADTYANREWIKAKMAEFSSKAEEPELRKLLGNPNFKAKGVDYDEVPLPALKQTRPTNPATREDIRATTDLVAFLPIWRQRIVELLLTEAIQDSAWDDYKIDLLVEFIDGDVNELILDLKDALSSQYGVDCDEIKDSVDSFVNRFNAYATDTLGAGWDSLAPRPYSALPELISEIDQLARPICSGRAL